jgi:hypothetical protein
MILKQSHLLSINLNHKKASFNTTLIIKMTKINKNKAIENKKKDQINLVLS